MEVGADMATVSMEAGVDVATMGTEDMVTATITILITTGETLLYRPEASGHNRALELQEQATIYRLHAMQRPALQDILMQELQEIILQM